MIIINGGTGFIGKSIVRELLERGEKVRILTRDIDASRKKLPSEHIEWVKGDVQDRNSIYSALAGADTVINCVQFPNHPVENHRKGYTYFNIDAKGTELQIEAAKKNGAKHFIYISGIGAGRDRSEPWFTAKDYSEKAVIESGIDYTIFRPSWIYGPEDRSLNKFVSFIKYLPFVPVIGTGKEKVQPVFINDIAKLVSASIKNTQAKNKIFEIGGPDELTMDEIIHILEDIIGRHPPLIHHPKPLMKFISFFMQILPEPPLSPDAVDFVTMEIHADTSLLTETFNAQLTGLKEGLNSYLKGRLK